MSLVLADHALPILIGDVFSFSQLPLILMLVVLLEAGVLYWYGWRPLLQAVGSALIMNLGSTLLGGITLLFLPPNLNFVDYGRGVLYSYDGVFTIFVLLLSYLLSVLSEASFLLLLWRSHPLSKIWQASWMTNLSSYAVIIVPSVFLVWLSRNT